jgi:hypothetical protein
MCRVAVIHLQMRGMRTPNAHTEVCSKRDAVSAGQREDAGYLESAEYAASRAAQKNTHFPPN